MQRVSPVLRASVYTIHTRLTPPIRPVTQKNGCNVVTMVDHVFISFYFYFGVYSGGVAFLSFFVSAARIFASISRKNVAPRYIQYIERGHSYTPTRDTSCREETNASVKRESPTRPQDIWNAQPANPTKMVNKIANKIANKIGQENILHERPPKSSCL